MSQNSKNAEAFLTLLGVGIGAAALYAMQQNNQQRKVQQTLAQIKANDAIRASQLRSDVNWLKMNGYY